MNARALLLRLLRFPPAAAGVVLLSFVLIHLAPGDPVFALAGEHGDAAYYAFMRARFGLDRPIPERLLTYAGRVARGDFGVSYVHGRAVSAVIAERLPATLMLTATALFLSTGAGLAVGLLTGRRPHGPLDTWASTVVLAFYATPVFWTGQLAVLLLAFGLGMFPVQGMGAAGGVAGLRGLADLAHHLLLPALVLAAQETAAVARLTRSGLMEELSRDHIRTARAKGLTERAVLVRHALPRALVPVAALVSARAGHLVTGAVIVETVFGWPGAGRLLLSALQTRDTPILLGLFFVGSLFVVAANLAADVFQAALDPRVRDV